MQRRHRFDLLRSQKILVALITLLVTAAGCSPPITAPGANIAYGQLNLSGYTLMRWQQGLDILVWHDLPESSLCQGSTSTSERAYWLRCHAKSAAGSAGSRIDWEVLTQDGQTAQFSIDSNAYDLTRGRLFLIRTRAEKTRVVQLQRELSAARVEDHRSIEAFARADPDIVAFFGRQTEAVQATPTSVPPTLVPLTSVPPTPVQPISGALPYDCLAAVSATRPLAPSGTGPNGTGDDCWLTLSDGDPTEITFYDDAQVTFRTSWGGDDVFFFAARKGDQLIKVTGATIRPAHYIACQFGGSIEAVKRFEVAYHSPGNPIGSPACLRDANADYRPLTTLCK